MVRSPWASVSPPHKWVHHVWFIAFTVYHRDGMIMQAQIFNSHHRIPLSQHVRVPRTVAIWSVSTWV